MHSQERIELYNAEKILITSLCKGQSDLKLKTEYFRALKNTNEEVNLKLGNSVNQFIKVIENVNLPYKLLKLWQQLDVSALNNNITETEFQFSRKYVEELLDIKLDKIQWHHLDNSLVEHSEGSCWACGDENHHIFTYHDSNGVISTDLLIHEVGHAADYSISRSLNDDNLLLGHATFREAIAYYCQFKYLSEYGSPSLRIGSCGAFVFTYLAILILHYCLEHNIELAELDSNEIIKSASLKELINSYDIFDSTGNYGRSFVANKIEEIKTRFSDLGNLVFHEIQPKFGIVIGLLLLDKDKEFIKTLISKNTIDNSIREIIESFFPDYDVEVDQLQMKMLDYFSL
ncbi:hypothetical protein [Citrobacter rodentium]|uniref:Uncharacterized protein n=2 Tax=Citrobacter rodentium TaxID=67825 RepID=D2TIG7_CITRI|nr:hypothetical protein [Citrobacter rodentium]KIQ51314.1 hypothetical protein TA05_10905 [Citrobacter rodentium]QBY28123.1 hypothetical protein E2R62_04175 [Citrobacter rodentium]UHO29999.1 hypothetical protein K7R23_18650 [Citrobacter rodentium NBRC 105723 = DSM 16636]CBG88294.1 hypothetical protein ROD_15301 [Citrobacter rodentium ICC168]HAT8011500.1 hypothetical protein [Citrobacter rodentium NBRC 105723 = DSM 16636]